MLALLSILFALALLGLTVYGLHRYQTMEVEFNVDRSLPLPPLDRSQPEAGFTSKKALATGNAKAKADQTRPDDAGSVISNSSSWQNAVTKLKNTGNYTEATSLCEKHLPLWGAYNQICMLLRSELKEKSLTSEEYETRTARLYKTAVIAEFLHNKSVDNGRLSNNQLRKLNLVDISNLEFPYAKIGYAHLRLIRKSDIKHMVELWGRPSGHLTPREYQADWWRKQVQP